MEKNNEKKNAVTQLFTDLLTKYFPAVKFEETTEEVKFESVTLEDGRVIEYENLEVGTQVNVIVEGQDPQPIEEGTFKISETQEIVTDAEGKIVSVNDIVTEESEAPAEEAQMNSMDLEMFLTTLREKLDLGKEGFRTITLSVRDDGKIEWGNILEESFTELKASLKASKEESKKIENDLKVKFEKEIEKQKLEFESKLKKVADEFSKNAGRGFVKGPGSLTVEETDPRIVALEYKKKLLKS